MHNFIRQRTNYKPHLVNCLQVTPRSASDKARLCCAAIFIHQLHNQLNSIPVKAALLSAASQPRTMKKGFSSCLGVLHFFSVSWAQMGHNKLGKTDSRRHSLQASSQVMLMLSGSQLSSWHVVVKVTTFWSNATSSLNVARAGPSSVSHRTLRAGMLLESWVPSQQNGPTQLQNPGSSFSSSTNWLHQSSPSKQAINFLISTDMF